MTSLNFDELVSATGATPRHIRYLVAEGFVPAPVGGRTHARYDEVHVAAVLRYERLRSLGFPPAAIRLLLGATDGIPMPIVPGVTLVVAPALIGSGGDVAGIAAKGAELIALLLAEDAPDGRHEAAG